MSELTISQAETAFRKAQTELADAKARLAPLEQAEQDAAEALQEVILKFQSSYGFATGPATKKKRTMKPYNITNESKIGRAGKAAYTRAINGGSGEKEAKAAQKSAEASLKSKLGVA